MTSDCEMGGGAWPDPLPGGRAGGDAYVDASAALQARQRDLFPLPLPKEFVIDEDRWRNLGRASRRKVGELSGQQRLVRDVVRAMNEMDAG